MSDDVRPQPDAGPGDPPAELVALCAGPSGALLRAFLLAGPALPLITGGHLEEDTDG